MAIEEKKTALAVKLKWVFAALVVVSILAAAKYFDVQEIFKSSLDRISNLGPTGWLIFVVIYILACVLFLPGAILTLGAGVIFGIVKGSILVSIASTLGAICAFLVGRYIARGLVEKKIEGNQKFKAIDDAVAKEGWKIVGLTRLSPIFPFNLLNYAYGVTKVSLKDYSLASWIGMMPGTVMYVYLGSLAGDLAALGSGSTTTTPAQWTIRVIGFAATVAVTVYVTRIARKALEQRVS